MTLHQQASVLSSPALRGSAKTGDPSLAAVVLWAALGLTLSIALAMADPDFVAVLQHLS